MIIFGFILLSIILGVILFFHCFENRIVYSVLYSIFLIFFGLLLLEVTSPKNIKYEWRNLKNNTILATHEVEPEAIYIWIKRQNSNEPVAYKLPWSIETAENLRKAKEKAKKNNTEIELNLSNDDLTISNSEESPFNYEFRERLNMRSIPKTLQ